MRAFDTGPGNMVLDAIVRKDATRHPRMMPGADGRRGDSSAVAHRTDGPSVPDAASPKSTGQEEFGAPLVRTLRDKQKRAHGCRLRTLLATCAAWTAEAIGSSRRLGPARSMT